MTSISQGIVLTTAMVLSSTVLYLTFSKQKTSPPLQNSQTPNPTHSNEKILRSCLYSEEKKKEKRKKNKKVKFAENVMVKEEEKTSDEEIIEGQGKQNRGGSNSNSMINCRNEIPETKTRGMPANRVALYNGILRDRVHRMASCH